MHKNNTLVSFYGTRGSFPASGSQFNVYGCATTCVHVNMSGIDILLDAGTGIVNAVPSLKDKTDTIPILLTHAHIDHVHGLVAFPLFYDNKKSFEIMAVPHCGFGAYEQVAALMKPPLWPVGPESFKAAVKYTDITSSAFNISHVCVELMESNHPGGSTIYKLSNGHASLVFCTDFEHSEDANAKLIEFAGDTSVLIYDGHYSDKEYESAHGWGHSTWIQGVNLAKKCRAKRLILTHHHPNRTDIELKQIELELQSLHESCSLAKANEQIII